ncbi:hypothetical protein NL676_025287 [Syzygium grande]|nr:hypothetical protein NL676_025287 [Syzygium grande]
MAVRRRTLDPVHHRQPWLLRQHSYNRCIAIAKILELHNVFSSSQGRRGFCLEVLLDSVDHSSGNYTCNSGAMEDLISQLQSHILSSWHLVAMAVVMDGISSSRSRPWPQVKSATSSNHDH